MLEYPYEGTDPVEIVVYFLIPSAISAVLVFLVVRALVRRRAHSNAPVWVFYWLAAMAALILGPAITTFAIPLLVRAFSLPRDSVAFALAMGRLFLPGIIGGILGSATAIVLSTPEKS